MWKHPNNLFDLLSTAIWGNLRKNGYIKAPQGPSPFQPAAANLLQPSLEWIAQVSQSDLEGEVPAWFRRGLKRHLGAIAAQIERTSGYSMIPEMWQMITGIAMVDQPTASLCHILATGVHLLVGSETKYLIGIRGGKPAFKQLVPTLKSPEDVLAIFQYGSGFDISYLDSSDVELIPGWQEDAFDRLDFPFPKAHYPTLKLLEDAHYNQRYIVNPLGAYVSLRNLDPLVGLTLKLKPGLTDRNYYDFVAVFDFTGKPTKRHATVFDGSFASGIVQGLGIEQEVSRHHYLMWIVAMIYHDLVTARKIEGVRTPVDDESLVLTPHREAPSWVYIPRKLRGYKHQPRIAKENSRSMTPHHVSGHPRKGNLSNIHRIELEKFEAETGLKVLDLLERNPGYTFVRPHISPGGTSLATLPRFIHARLQADIAKMMEQRMGSMIT